jgi:hypothetical protein
MIVKLFLTIKITLYCPNFQGGYLCLNLFQNVHESKASATSLV